MLKTKISADYLAAFKAGDTVKKSLLSVVKGEIQTIEKNVGQADLSDSEVEKILNKTAKSLRETIKLSDDAKSKAELEIIESYLPQAMSRREIVQLIKDTVGSGEASMGLVMKAFAGKTVDRKEVSAIYAEIYG